MFTCEECIPLIEEYFDKEVDAKTSERMSAHISACAECANALDALSLEGEMYARYERGLEPTPALWSRISAGIARTPETETIAEQRPFLNRMLASIAAAFASLASRPALASALALIVLGVTAGSLWLAHRPRTANSPLIAAVGMGQSIPPISTPAASPNSGRAIDAPVNIIPKNVSGEVAFVRAGLRGNTIRRAPSVPLEESRLTDDDINRLLGDARQTVAPTLAAANPDAGSHATPEEFASLLDAPKLYVGLINANTQLPDAGEKEMARHVEQAQMLLRSIKNARASDGGSGTVNVAYEKSLSRQLLADNATLKLEADVKGDKDTKQVLATIEPFLLDIANMREHATREEVRSMRERVKKTEIIAALQVY